MGAAWAYVPSAPPLPLSPRILEVLIYAPSPPIQISRFFYFPRSRYCVYFILFCLLFSSIFRCCFPYYPPSTPSVRFLHTISLFVFFVLRSSLRCCHVSPGLRLFYKTHVLPGRNLVLCQGAESRCSSGPSSSRGFSCGVPPDLFCAIVAVLLRPPVMLNLTLTPISLRDVAMGGPFDPAWCSSPIQDVLLTPAPLFPSPLFLFGFGASA